MVTDFRSMNFGKCCRDEHMESQMHRPSSKTDNLISRGGVKINVIEARSSQRI